MQKYFAAIIFLVVMIYSGISSAGGPLVLEGPNGNTPVTYAIPAITLNIESGNLGLLSNAEAVTLFNDAFNLWNNVNSSRINLIADTTQITADINFNNFESFLPNVDGTIFHADDNLNPVVFDNDGQIIDAFFGSNASDFTIGFSASILTRGASNFDEGYVVINGKDLGLPDITFRLLVAHEIGHFFGLDHSQVNINNTESDFAAPLFCRGASSRNQYPIMYPIACRNDNSLHIDDIVAVSVLYPEININDNFGILNGQFLSASGNAILGANIWAQNIITGDVISIVSDYLKQNNGFFELYLPAGTYTLHANSINTEFVAGSGVGPYSRNSSDASFITPHPIADVTYQGDNAPNDEVIVISANQTVTINFTNTGAIIVPPVPKNSDNGGGLSDIFGATSYTTLLLLFAPLWLRHLMIKRYFRVYR